MSPRGKPNLIVLGGPNGAGKTTAAPALLKGTLKVTEFVNADTIAQGLSGFEPEASAMEAGRVMLRRLDQLASRRVDFAFESTLASRSFAPWITRLTKSGYAFRLIFLWLPTVELSLERVAERVRSGGHDVPEETVRRRYRRGIDNFLSLYRPLATSWRVYDNSGAQGARLISEGRGRRTEVLDVEIWREISKGGKPPEG